MRTLDRLAPYAKALAAAIVTAAAYLAGVLPAEGSLSDVTTVQWLGLVVALGAAGGVTYAVPNRPVTPPPPRRASRP